jgi:3-oxoacyl-(acyl-carrier-protein) synthase
VPPSLNLHRPIAALNFIRHTSQEGDVGSALVAAYGFGGHAAMLALRRCDA